MRKHYYNRLASCLEKAQEELAKFKKIKEACQVWRKLKKKVPDVNFYLDNYGRVEFRSEWVNKNWTHTTHGEGGCSSYKMRGYIIIDEVKIYSRYIAHLGYTEYPDYRASYFVDNSNIEEAVENMGEGIREPMEKAIEKYQEWYSGDDDEY